MAHTHPVPRADLSTKHESTRLVLTNPHTGVHTVFIDREVSPESGRFSVISKLPPGPQAEGGSGTRPCCPRVSESQMKEATVTSDRASV